MLKLVLRLIGTSSLLALIFVFVPNAWMASIHRDLGLGEMPDTPVVWYLARSTSAIYALLGGLFWTLSLDPPRYRTVLIYLGAALTLFGAILLWVDWSAGLPFFWRVWEGPFLMVVGLFIFRSSRDL